MLHSCTKLDLSLLTGTSNDCLNIKQLASASGCIGTLKSKADVDASIADEIEKKEAALQEMKIESHVCEKGTKGAPLTEAQKESN